jgi:hypothetical protein
MKSTQGYNLFLKMIKRWTPWRPKA